ncbi:MAG: hypothetical protein FJY85_21005, partial [Deltaproteobacteria bacterium]|nr:hypothetical protein [Deltaproteobacteria bacterium]
MELSQLASYMAECLAQEYEAADDWLPCESAEGCFQGEHFDTYDLLTEEIELVLPNDHDRQLLGDLVSAIGNQYWCPADPFGPSTSLHAQLSWRRFREVVTHQRRYFFHDVQGDEYGEAS